MNLSNSGGVVKSGFLNQFSAFILRANFINMALGILLGTAFGNLTKSLVSDIIMPCIAYVSGDFGTGNWSYTLKQGVFEGENLISSPIIIKYGQFIDYGINFLIVSLVAFIVLKVLKKINNKGSSDLDWTSYIKK